MLTGRNTGAVNKQCTGLSPCGRRIRAGRNDLRTFDSVQEESRRKTGLTVHTLCPAHRK